MEGDKKKNQVFAQKAPYLGFFEAIGAFFGRMSRRSGAGDEKQPPPGARLASGILMIRGPDEGAPRIPRHGLNYDCVRRPG